MLQWFQQRCSRSSGFWSVLPRLARLPRAASAERVGSVRLRIETLETRDMLSATTLPLAQVPLQIAPLVTNGTPYGYTPAQMRHAYGFDQIRFANRAIVGDGRGQTIAIVAAYDDPTIGSDLYKFDATFGLPNPPSIWKTNEYGTMNWFPAYNQGWALEISLDVEWAHAIAPARISCWSRPAAAHLAISSPRSILLAICRACRLYR